MNKRKKDLVIERQPEEDENETAASLPPSTVTNVDHQDKRKAAVLSDKKKTKTVLTNSSSRIKRIWAQMGVTHLIVGIPLALSLYLYYTTNPSHTASQQTGPIVQISNGLLQGLQSESRDGRPFYEFLGIPYAQPPIGDLRFEAPKPPKDWEGVRPAISFGSQCTQIEFFTGKLLGQENCLFLNVFTPTLKSETNEINDVPVPLVPVMVFIHGGYFMAGSSTTYRANYLMDEDVVLVTLNYRLASLGFLNTGDEVVRGNMGLKDQNLALKWVQENIQNFGGDPQRVTIFGPSAGAAAVHYHTLSPLSKGLFSKAISQSGTAIKVWSFVENPKAQARRLGKSLNCPTENSIQLVQCLKSLDANLIISTHREYLNVFLDPLAIFAPSLENVIDETTFLPDHPYSILAQGKENRVPWLIGLNSEEGLLFSSRILKNKELMSELDNNFENSLPVLLGYSEHPDKIEITRQVQNFYFPNGKPSAFSEHFENYTNMLSDRLYFTATHEAILLQSRHSPVYIYYYTYPADFSFSQILTLSGMLPPILEFTVNLGTRWVKQNIFGKSLHNLGICHGDEIIMLFDLGFLVNIKSSDKDYEMSKKMVKLWTDFASLKDNGAPLKIDQVEWTPTPTYPAQLNYLNLDKTSSIIKEPFTARIHFWKSLGLL